jgi:hypothetical protein
MPYPRQLNLGEEIENKLKAFLQNEITLHLAERTDYIQDLKNWQRDYWVPVPTENATTPFVGASRIIIPLTAIAVEAIHARVWMALFGTEPFASAKFHALTIDHENAFRKFYNYELKHGIKAHHSLESPILDVEKYGTGIVKPDYCYLTKTAMRPSPLDPTKEEEIPIVIKRGAVFQHCPIANYIQPYSATDPQTAEWCGEIHLETPYYMTQLEKSGFFIPGTLEKLKSYYQRTVVGPTTQDVPDSQKRMEHTVPIWPKQVEWFEIWLSFNVDDDPKGETKEIVVHWHRASNTLMSIMYNWYTDLRRPYEIGNFFKVEGRWKGIGICKQSEQFQKIVTTLHRQRIDAGTIANMRMFKVHRLSNYGPDEPIFPGKMWILDDMTHIEPIQAMEVYTSAFANEQAALLYEQQRVGVNELTQGMPQQGTPGTATDTTLRLQEGSKKQDLNLYNIRDFVSRCYVDGLLITQQFGSRTLDMYMMTHPEDAQLIAQVLSAPPELIKDSALFELTAVGLNSNKSVDRTNWMQIGQVTQQFLTGILQAAQLGVPLAVGPIAQEGILASSEIFEQFLETYDVRDESKISMKKFLIKLFADLAQAQSKGQNGGPILPGQPGQPVGQLGPGNPGGVQQI